MSNLEAVRATRKFGLEPFTDGDQNLTLDLLSFWRWSGSGILSNATRGVLAEYLVARALGTGVDDVRDEWRLIEPMCLDACCACVDGQFWVCNC